MKVPSYTRRRDSREMLSMTPMIDIVFLLLIFFVCASIGQRPLFYFSSESVAAGTGVDVPIEQPPPKLLEKIDLKIRRQGEQTVVEMDGRTIGSLEALRPVLLELSELASDVPVNIDAADEIPYADLIAVLDICRETKFESLNFVLPPPTGRRPAAAPPKRYAE